MPISRGTMAGPAPRPTRLVEFLGWVGINLAGLWLAVQLIDGVHLAGAMNLVNVAALFAFANRVARSLLRNARFPSTLVIQSATVVVVNAVLFMVVTSLTPGGLPLVVRGVPAALLASGVLSVVDLVLSLALYRIGGIRHPF